MTFTCTRGHVHPLLCCPGSSLYCTGAYLRWKSLRQTAPDLTTMRCRSDLSRAGGDWLRRARTGCRKLLESAPPTATRPEPYDLVATNRLQRPHFKIRRGRQGQKVDNKEKENALPPSNSELRFHEVQHKQEVGRTHRLKLKDQQTQGRCSV